MAFKRNGVIFNFENPDMYNYEAFTGGNISEKDLRSEYTSLRSTAKKRLQRMKGTRFETSQTYLKNINAYPTIKEIETQMQERYKGASPETIRKAVNANIAKRNATAFKMLTAKKGSISGMKEIERRTIQTLQERGLDFINADNIQRFGEYMEYLRSINKGKQFDSEGAAELFGISEAKGIHTDEILQDFNFWSEHAEQLENTPKPRNKNNRTGDEYRRRMAQQDRKNKR